MANPEDVRLEIHFTWGHTNRSRTRRAIVYRVMPIHHLPSPGDWVMVTEDWRARVRDRHWEYDGRPVLRLVQYVVDPVETVRDQVNWKEWRTEHQGDPLRLLEAAGWTVYELES